MKMKQWIATAAAAILIVTGARADDSWLNTRLCYDTGGDLFHAHETSLDLFGLYEGVSPSTPPVGSFNSNPRFRHGDFGGGVGGNYFFTRYVGVEGEVTFLAGQPRFVNSAGGNLVLRLPIDKIHLAPYIFGGGGAMWNGLGYYPVTTGYGDAGAGLEFRINPHMGFFGDARYIWRTTAAPNQIACRVGLRLGF